jgi:hypothetical protein
MDTSIHDLLAATLTELGLPAPTTIIQMMLMRDGYFAGWKFHYHGGYAVLHADGTREFYDVKGTLLKTVALEAGRGAAA